MEGELAQGNLGDLGNYDVSFKGGELVVEFQANVAIGSAGLLVKISAEKVLDEMAKAIPGSIDDAVIGVIKAALMGK